MLKEGGSYFSARFQPENLQCRGNNHPLLFVVWRRYTFESLEPFHGVLATLGLVRYHTANCTPKDLSGSTEVERSSKRLDVTPQAQELQILQLIPVEVTAHVDAFASDNDDLVAVQDEFGDCRGQSAHQMATAIDHDRLKQIVDNNKLEAQT